jgi:hypothetical protein
MQENWPLWVKSHAFKLMDKQNINWIIVLYAFFSRRYFHHRTSWSIYALWFPRGYAPLVQHPGIDLDRI